MNPTGLVHLSPDTMRERARHGGAACPLATPAEMKWAAIACLAMIALSMLLIVAIR